MKRSVLFWTLAVIVTLVSLVYQRVTGPSYPVSGKVQLNGRTIPFRLDRSHPGPTNAVVEIKTGDSSIAGIMSWKRHKTDDPWVDVRMIYKNGALQAELPHQPVAAKLLYRIELKQGDQHVMVNGDEPVILRFRGETPIWIIVPHVFAMFCAFLFSARAGLEFFSKEPNFRKYMYATLGCLAVGGFMLGPLMQYYSFNLWWTGWPLGTDLTDNKTAIAFLCWLIAAFMYPRSKQPKRWALAASIIMIAVYLIPHSVLGSEYDFNKAEKPASQTQSPQ
ncbi:MAG TPA: hypothetical protein VMH23_07685 [Bacteroidota bacterium]|nr:hypothetical protein [Bacteroidota bacterium]